MTIDKSENGHAACGCAAVFDFSVCLEFRIPCFGFYLLNRLNNGARLFNGMALEAFHIPVDIQHIDPVVMVVTVGDDRLRGCIIKIRET